MDATGSQPPSLSGVSGLGDALPVALVSMQVVSVDYYMLWLRHPQEFVEALDSALPVIRVFGSTEQGQRTCLHVHGVMPYFYFRPADILNASFDDIELVRQYLSPMERQLNHELAKTHQQYQRKPRKYIHKMEAVVRTPLYGYFSEPKVFIKVSLRDPDDTKHLVKALESGALSGVSMQPYEAHIPYLLQFTIDYNVQPMSWLHIGSSAKFRGPLPADEPLFPPPQLNTTASAKCTAPVQQDRDNDHAILSQSSVGVPVNLANALSRSSTIASAVGMLSPVRSHCSGDAPVNPKFDEGDSQMLLHQTSTAASSCINELSVGNLAFAQSLNHGASLGRPFSATGNAKDFLSSTCPTNDLSRRYQSPAPAVQGNKKGAASDIEDLILPGMTSPAAGSYHPLHSSAGNTSARRSFNGNRASLLTQSTIPKHLLWDTDIMHCNTGAVENQTMSTIRGDISAMTADQLREIEILKGEWQTQEVIWPKPAEPVVPVISSRIPVEDHAFAIHKSLDKISTAELEIDVHVKDVLNQFIKPSKFGSELWEEERLRCLDRGIDPKQHFLAPTQPSTFTIHRPITVSEQEYRQRLRNLYLKGYALKTCDVDFGEDQDCRPEVPTAGAPSPSVDMTFHEPSFSQTIMENLFTQPDLRHEVAQLSAAAGFCSAVQVADVFAPLEGSLDTWINNIQSIRQQSQALSRECSQIFKAPEHCREDDSLRLRLSQPLSQGNESAVGIASDQCEAYVAWRSDALASDDENASDLDVNDKDFIHQKEAMVAGISCPLFLPSQSQSIKINRNQVDRRIETYDEENSAIMTSTQLDPDEFASKYAIDIIASAKRQSILKQANEVCEATINILDIEDKPPAVSALDHDPDMSDPIVIMTEFGYQKIPSSLAQLDEGKPPLPPFRKKRPLQVTKMTDVFNSKTKTSRALPPSNTSANKKQLKPSVRFNLTAVDEIPTSHSREGSYRDLFSESSASGMEVIEDGIQNHEGKSKQIISLLTQDSPIHFSRVRKRLLPAGINHLHSAIRRTVGCSDNNANIFLLPDEQVVLRPRSTSQLIPIQEFQLHEHINNPVTMSNKKDYVELMDSMHSNVIGNSAVGSTGMTSTSNAVVNSKKKQIRYHRDFDKFNGGCSFSLEQQVFNDLSAVAIKPAQPLLPVLNSKDGLSNRRVDGQREGDGDSSEDDDVASIHEKLVADNRIDGGMPLIADQSDLPIFAGRSRGENVSLAVQQIATTRIQELVLPLRASSMIAGAMDTLVNLLSYDIPMTSQSQLPRKKRILVPTFLSPKAIDLKIETGIYSEVIMHSPSYSGEISGRIDDVASLADPAQSNPATMYGFATRGLLGIPKKSAAFRNSSKRDTYTSQINTPTQSSLSGDGKKANKHVMKATLPPVKQTTVPLDGQVSSSPRDSSNCEQNPSLPFIFPSPQQTSLVATTTTNNKNSRLTLCSCEVYCHTRNAMLPNPKKDAVQAIFYTIYDQVSNVSDEITNTYHGIIQIVQPPLAGGFATSEAAKVMEHTLCDRQHPQTQRLLREQMHILVSSGLKPNTTCELVLSEKELFQSFVHHVQTIDPDFLLGYDIQRNSFGYLISRGEALGIPSLLQSLSKIPTERPNRRNEFDEYGAEHDSGIHITGRIVLNVWRIARSELKVMSHTYSHTAACLLERRVPYYTCEQLTRWFRVPDGTSRHFTVRHFQMLAELNLLFLDKLDFIRRTAESARLYGIDFYSVISRGSQYRVEAVLIAKAHAMGKVNGSEGYIAISPSRHQVANQAPMAVIPLVMEPRSIFYQDPVVVLDFQSLYPSMIIAYNLCFSTILGKAMPGTHGEKETTSRLGVIDFPEVFSAEAVFGHSAKSRPSAKHDPFPDNSELSPNNDMFALGIDSPPVDTLFELPRVNSSDPDPATNAADWKPYVSPNGSIFCSKKVREGILPLMLKEILDTRVMVKQAMKTYKGSEDRVLRRVLDARQLAIKLLANVTYGYTAAGFSGRMPMAELADAIVQSGRSTLEWTIKEIRDHPRWKAEVVYGDTDSVFVKLPGRSKAEAFSIGREIAAYITSLTPPEVILKFEKVYMPCILVTKKRYVGNCYETEDQVTSHLDAKGIEMIRRDQCPVTMKLQEKALRILFETKDMSAVKQYLVQEWAKIHQGGDALPLTDFIFRKEVKFGKYSLNSQPPGAIVAAKAAALDEMAIPPFRWRVPYVVVCGGPKALLRDLVVSPEDFLRRGSELKINSTYYAGKCINPALNRVLSLCGADVSLWYRNMAKPKLRIRHISYDTAPESMISRSTATSSTNPSNRSTVKRQQQIVQFVTKGTCELCSNDAAPGRTLCTHCLSNPATSMIAIVHHLNVAEKRDHHLHLLCQNCTKKTQPHTLFHRGQMIGPETCQSLDCAVFFERCRAVLRIEDYQQVSKELE